jgi:hypothetical protein
MKSTYQFDTKQFILTLVNLGERQLANETLAGAIIKKTLSDLGQTFALNSFTLSVPSTRKLSLTANDQPISEIANCGLVSGEILDKNHLLSSLISSQQNINLANLNFNPACRAISRSNHYHAPAIALSPKALKMVLKSKKIRGAIEVEKISHTTENILVGNLLNPDHIIFAHYDSIGPGAIDNASGVAVLLKALARNPALTKTNLFVFAAAEELSYDYPIYWGHGFRVFEKDFPNLIQSAKKLITVDCVGHGPTELVKEIKYLKLGFPLTNIEALANKTTMLCADFDKLMTVYHSKLDTGRLIKPKFLKDAIIKLTNLLSD